MKYPRSVRNSGYASQGSTGNGKHAHTAWIMFPIIFIVLVGLACSLSNPTPVFWALTSTAQAAAATSTAFVATQAAGYKPLPTYTQIPTIAPLTPTSLPNALAPNGPWLVYPAQAGQALFAVNIDGSAPYPVIIPPLMDPRDLTEDVSPNGGMVAFRSGLKSSPDQASLYLLHLPEGQLQLVTPLLSPAEKSLLAAGKDSRAAEAASGVTQQNAIAWSPDGHYLAFVAALDRNSADVYLYDTRTEKINRATFSANMNATPFWSPDSHWLYEQEVLSYGDGTSWKPGIVRAIDIQTGTSFEIYAAPANSSGEVFVGWLNDTTFLSYSRNASGGFDLRSVDTAHARINILFAGAFSQIAFAPKSGVIAITHNLGTPASELDDGIYLITANTTQPQLVQLGEWTGLGWSTNGNLFLATGAQGSLMVSPDGKKAIIPGEAHCNPSPDTNWLACWGDTSSDGKDGLRLYRSSGELLQQISSSPVQALSWQPNSKGFFFISGNQLDLAAFPSLQVTTIDADLKPGILPVLVWLY